MRFDFEYSFIYDSNWHRDSDVVFNKEKARDKYEHTLKNIERVFPLEKQQIASDQLSDSLGLDWKSDKIKVYLVNSLPISGFSNPLTIKISDDTFKMIHTLIHEATHVLLTQNKGKRDHIERVMKRLGEKYPDESVSIRYHVLINVVSNRVFEKMYGKEEAKRVVSIEREYKGLKKAYELIDQLDIGEDLIKFFGELTK